jgi:hypothetical protein
LASACLSERLSGERVPPAAVGYLPLMIREKCAVREWHLPLNQTVTCAVRIRLGRGFIAGKAATVDPADQVRGLGAMHRDQVGAPRVSSRAVAEGVCRVLVIECGHPPTDFELSGRSVVREVRAVALDRGGDDADPGWVFETVVEVVEGARAAEVRPGRGRGCLRGLRLTRDAEE